MMMSSGTTSYISGGSVGTTRALPPAQPPPPFPDPIIGTARRVRGNVLTPPEDDDYDDEHENNNNNNDDDVVDVPTMKNKRTTRQTSSNGMVSGKNVNLITTTAEDDTTTEAACGDDDDDLLNDDAVDKNYPTTTTTTTRKARTNTENKMTTFSSSTAASSSSMTTPTSRRPTSTTIPRLERRQSMAGNILIIDDDHNNNSNSLNPASRSSSKKKKTAYLLQRKLRKILYGSIRVGYVLCDPAANNTNSSSAASSAGGLGSSHSDAGGDLSTTSGSSSHHNDNHHMRFWGVVPCVDGRYKHEMVAVKVQLKAPPPPSSTTTTASAGDDDDEHAYNNIDHREAVQKEQAVLQYVASYDPDNVGHVMNTMLVAADHNHVYTITPYYHKDGSLYDLCMMQQQQSNYQHLTEMDARYFFKQILQGLITLQKMEICHRNLSLDNVLLRGNQCTLANLGSALRIPTSTSSDGGCMIHLIEPQPTSLLSYNMNTNQASQYVAPELFNGTSSFDGYAVDLWAAGIMLFIMLFGCGTSEVDNSILFTAPVVEDYRYKEICIHHNLKEIIKRRYEEEGNAAARKKQRQQQQQQEGAAGAKDDDVDHHTTTTSVVSDDAIDLLQSMLRAEPRERLTLAGVLEHPWIRASNNVDDSTMLSPAVMTMMESSSDLENVITSGGTGTGTAAATTTTTTKTETSNSKK